MQGHLSRTIKFALVAAFTLPACSGSWHHSPVQSVSYADSVIHYPGDGGVVISAGRLSPKTICVAPPAQAALLRQTSTSTRAEVDVIEVVGAGVQVDRATAEALARMYEQNERSLFLQYSMYRLCEAYMNSMLTPASSREILAMEQNRYETAAKSATEANAVCEETKRQLESSKAAAKYEPKDKTDDSAATLEMKKQLAELDKQISSLDCQEYKKIATSATATASLLESRIKALPKDSPADVGFLYWIAFQRILDTSVELARLDAQAAKLRAEAEAALAKEAQAKAEAKVKGLEESKKTLDGMRDKALDSAIERVRCGNGCSDKKDDKPADKKISN